MRKPLVVAAVADLLEHGLRLLAPPAESAAQVGRGQLAGASRTMAASSRRASSRAGQRLRLGKRRASRSTAIAPQAPSCSTRCAFVSTRLRCSRRRPGRRPSSRAPIASRSAAGARSSGPASRPPVEPSAHRESPRPAGPAPSAAYERRHERAARCRSRRAARCLPTHARPALGQLVLHAPDDAHLLASSAMKPPSGSRIGPGVARSPFTGLPERGEDDVGLREE